MMPRFDPEEADKIERDRMLGPARSASDAELKRGLMDDLDDFFFNDGVFTDENGEDR